MNNRVLGPNAKRLLAYFVAREAIPPGGGFIKGMQAMSKLGDLTRIGLAKMDQAIAMLKATHDNPYGTDEEALAAAILNALKQREDGGE